MKKGWTTRYLDQISVNLDHKRVPITKSDRVAGEFPYYGASGIVDYVADYIFEGDTLLVSEDGANLLARASPIAFPATGRYWVNNHAHILKFSEPTTQRYVELYLESIALDEYITGAAQPKLNQKALNSIPIPVAPPEEQRRIVAILDETFDSIATATVNTARNLQNAHELFENCMQSLFDERGSGWIERTLEDVCEITSKLVDPRNPEYLDLPHVGAGNIESKSGAVVDVKSAREEQLISGKFLFDKNTVLYSKIRPYLMKVVRPEFSGLCSADIYPLVPKVGCVDRNYLYYLLLTSSFTEYAIRGSARAGMPKVNRDHLFAYRLWMPSVKEQAKLAVKLDAVGDVTQRIAEVCNAKLAALEELKKSLLHHAFTGQLTANKAEDMVEAVA